MKYLPLRDFEDATNALNFDTPDCHVVGGCDLYTTKAAGSDKKLYKNIESSLESQHESVLRLSASLSPPQAESLAGSLNLSRSSPFGPLSQISSRRTFAYLIATLNASHPDYDFSHILRPSDFRKERSLRAVINTIDTTLYNLRPRPSGALLAVPPASSGAAGNGGGRSSPGGAAQAWGPRMWRLIDNEMGLRDCAVYSYAPEEDPFDGEEGSIWSLNYFFFNKHRKRVCYLYLRGLSAMSHSPVMRPTHVSVGTKGLQRGGSYLSAGLQRRRGSRGGSAGSGFGDGSSAAAKRASYWLGDVAEGRRVSGGWPDDDDDDVMVIADPGDDEVYRDEEFMDEFPDDDLDEVDEEEEDEDEYDEAAVQDQRQREREKSAVRDMNEHVADTMEL
ncbi:uncharacterized protein K452DRAFT_299326 [Aplosporella prunicola CBS 121167]|uniref:Repressor of RNA polymerase III transcription MAF1 n=1 Tax=Aplosporella prunicola CBS 121167 TaxID=1176127 RepID=A0A6A6B8T7_9PEZI|nr:uncharacterized protein K452DRAFT_299326 [Aplosporella prunicola CBS 121167]KAF2140589.1 hypothetical protein K452DRAFT_299326 [Aplosporella prunicola CBS 121167]